MQLPVLSHLIKGLLSQMQIIQANQLKKKQCNNLRTSWKEHFSCGHITDLRHTGTTANSSELLSHGEDQPDIPLGDAASAGQALQHSSRWVWLFYQETNTQMCITLKCCQLHHTANTFRHPNTWLDLVSHGCIGFSLVLFCCGCELEGPHSLCFRIRQQMWLSGRTFQMQ